MKIYSDEFGYYLKKPREDARGVAAATPKFENLLYKLWALKKI